MALKIGLIVVLVILAFLAYAATRPSEFRLKRTARINASPETIFPHINDFHRWAAWSPFEKLDPAMQKTFSGAPAGKGAVYEWEGNNKAGKGRMEIVESAAPNRVGIDLHFMKPFDARNRTTFTVAPTGSGTDVSWEMAGKNEFVGKIFHIFVDMDKMLGRDFDSGLANLKSVAEAQT